MPLEFNLDVDVLESFGQYLQTVEGEMQATCTIMKKHLNDGRSATKMGVIVALLDQIDEYIVDIEKLLAGVGNTGEAQVKKARAIKAVLEEMEEEFKKVKTR